MARALESRIAKLEKGDRGTDDGGPFYLLWVEPGEDRAMALAAAHRQGKCPADVPIYCAEWKAPESFTRRGRILGQRPRSRVTNQRRLSEDEVAVLFKSICDDLNSSGFSPSPNSGDDVRGEERLRRMTDRELVGEILSGGGPARRRVTDWPARIRSDRTRTIGDANQDNFLSWSRWTSRTSRKRQRGCASPSAAARPTRKGTVTSLPFRAG